jgi:D-alanyl-lipoteichoic acid acyltransferase DltB (MBOAT superfamily)
MLFDSTAYVLFLAFVVLICWGLNFRNQNRFLLAASYFFYGWWDWRFLLLMIASTTLDFIIARRIDAATTDRARKVWLTFSLIANFSVLGFFKYFNFFLDFNSLVGQTCRSAFSRSFFLPAFPSIPSRKSPTSWMCTSAR